MTIVLFLIDTSVSMNQRAYLGGKPTLLDIAKGAVETFLKIRQRDPSSRGDRYMLLTFDDPPANIKAGWKENIDMFKCELKNLEANCMTTMGAAVKNALDVLNVNRMQTGIDTYGQGRCPYYSEPSVILVITDGGKLSSLQSVTEELNLPLTFPMPGSELTREPFRWDQRLFSLVLRLAGTPPVDRDPTAMVPSDVSAIDSMCEVTGGRSYSITSQRMLMQCLESIAQKLNPGVVINFEKFGPEPPPVTSGGDVDGVPVEFEKENNNQQQPQQNGDDNSQNGVDGDGKPAIWHSCRKLIYVPRNVQKGYAVGHWPLPESFWPDVNSPALPPRSAHPIVKFSCVPHEPMVVDNFPFDKYELEPCPLTLYLLSRKQPNVCWQVFVSNSYKNSEVGHPFGYLKPSSNLNAVNLFVMPYNYPVVLSLLDDLFKVHKLKFTREWRQQFDNYIRNVPLYYIGPLKRSLQRLGVPSIITDGLVENGLSYSVVNYLKRLKNQAKAEFDKMVATVGTQPPGMKPGEGIRLNSAPAPGKPSSAVWMKNWLSSLSNPTIPHKFEHLKEQLIDHSSACVLSTRAQDIWPQAYKNPFDVSRLRLIDQIGRMRTNYLQSSIANARLQDQDQMHSMPVGTMGNYQDYLKLMPQPLREIETTPLRQHMFGNPFKIDKRMMVDEADIDLVGSHSPKASKRHHSHDPHFSSNKRRPGPLPRDTPVRRPFSPTPVSTNQSERPRPPSPESSDTSEISMEIEDLIMPQLTAVEPGRLSPVGDVVAPPPRIGGVAIGGLTPPVLTDYSTTNGFGGEGPVERIVNGSWSDEEDDEDGDEELTRTVGLVTENRLGNHVDRDVDVSEANQRLKKALFKRIRRPGKNYNDILKELPQLKGSANTKATLVRELTTEALRFKRKALADLLTTAETELLANGAMTAGRSARPRRTSSSSSLADYNSRTNFVVNHRQNNGLTNHVRRPFFDS